MPGTVVCTGIPTGLTLTATVFPDGSDTAAETGTACTEATNRKSVYTFSTSATGLHLIHIKSGSNVIWSAWGYLASSGTIDTYESRLEALAGQSSGLALKSDVPTTANIRTELSTELGRIDAAVTSRSTLSASGVRTELATELGRIDAAVSSRLASASYTAPDNATISTIASNVTSILGKFTGITLLARWLGALAGKTADSTTLAEINATTAGAGFDNTTDSLQAISDAGGGGGGGATVEEIVAGLSAVDVTVQNPVINSGRIEIVAGDDYYHADGRALTFTITGTQPEYTGATAVMKIRDDEGHSITSATGTVVTATGATRVVRFEFADTATNDLVPTKDGAFQVIVTLSGGNVITPVRGTAVVLERVGSS